MMMGLILACGWAAFASPRFLPDELPPNIDGETRAELLAKWQKGYTAQLKKVKAAIDDAEALSKFPQSAREGRAALVKAKNDLALLRKQPVRAAGGIFQYIYVSPNPGTVGIPRNDHMIVADPRINGTIVETVVTFNARDFGGVKSGDKVVARYYLADNLRVRKGAKITLDGVWYVAGNIEIGGKQMPVLYRFEIKPDEVPK